ncbi:transcriptional regulator, ArgP family [Bacteriovorax sp. BAL6_X]|uniref:ArgP/LysG family DNA-binding transcriptional regulator n=1 Tax=Bacteriovorax sp. BAL6_X TaxID=1201290 RepID=UPI00038570E3|nr:ArgP/LysG family DNA-binding transcriptional regulator [Bacteriovorax sp. BAL6_X]EPZ49712.1 transcriptional regulator, ArgP family [Bacteriovorax sp. BAL6_X]
MIDYHALRALQAVIEYQSFELASKAIGISQSAVTQRIQNFESFLGTKLLIRKAPYRATEKGKSYLNLLRKVTSLENEILEDDDIKKAKPTLKIAMNRDSLDLFFHDVLTDNKVSQVLTLQIIADDQDNTLKYLKSGQVDMCISSEKKPLPNHTSTHLGDMVYSLVCSKKFYKEYFSEGVNKKTLSEAPLVVFDKYDKAQHTYLRENFKVDKLTKMNLMPSVSSFKKAILGGYGYGLLPFIDMEREMKKRKFVQLNPSKNFSVSLYLHQWEYQREHIKIFNEKLIKAAQKL